MKIHSGLTSSVALSLPASTRCSKRHLTFRFHIARRVALHLRDFSFGGLTANATDAVLRVSKCARLGPFLMMEFANGDLNHSSSRWRRFDLPPNALTTRLRSPWVLAQDEVRGAVRRCIDQIEHYLLSRSGE